MPARPAAIRRFGPFRRNTFGDVLAHWFTKHATHEEKNNWATVFGSLVEADPDTLKKIEAQAGWKKPRKAGNGEVWPIKKLPPGYQWAVRNNNLVGAIYAVGIDVDDGTPFEDACAMVEKLGLFGLLYTTHSHGSTSLEIDYEKLRKWSAREGNVVEKEELTTEHVRAFLAAEGKYKLHVNASARFDRWEQTAKGIMIYVDIDPIDKFRAVFLLDKPYIPSSFKMSSADVATQWKEIVLGVGKLLGMKPDKKATDLARLFYEPVHHPLRPDSKIVIYAGDHLLDWEQVERPKDDRNTSSADPDRFVVESVDLRVWAKHFADAFLPTKLFDAECGERIVKRQGEGKFTVQCPHDGDHSNPGDPRDYGSFVADGDHDSFAWGCSHDGCEGRDRLDRIKQAIEEGWFGIEALTDPDYSFMPEDDFADALAAFEKENAKALTRRRQGKKRASGSGADFAVILGVDGYLEFAEEGRFYLGGHEARPWIFDKVSELPACVAFRIVAVAVDAFGGSATITIQYETRHNGPRELTFEKALIYRKAELLERLAANLFPMDDENGVVALFKLLDFPVDTLLVERTGWHAGAFLHPGGEVIAGAASINEDDMDALEESRGLVSKLRLRGGAVRGDWSRGSLDGWKVGAATCFKNGAADREQFALGVMMGGAGIVADFLDVQDLPIFNFSGRTSHGKSSSAKAAATVCAAPNKNGNFHTLNKTDNNIEGVLSARSGITMIFDEGKTTKPDVLEAIVWKIASKVGKGRAKQDGDTRPEKEFSGFVTMTVETPLAQLLANAGKTQPGGFNVRVLDIDITGAKPLDGEENVELFGGRVRHEHVPGALDVMAENYGHAWRPIVRRLQELGVSRVRGEVDRLATEITGHGANPAQSRAAKILALVWYSGLLMRELALIPACDLTRIIAWAWERRAEGTATDPFVSGMRTLLNNAQTRHGTDITDLEAADHWRGGELAAYRSGKPGHDILCVSTKPGKLAKLCEVTGITDAALRNLMNKAGLLELEGEKERPSWSRLPDRRSFAHWRVNMDRLAEFVEAHFND